MDQFPLLDDFMAYFQGVRERSAKTLSEYHYDLRLFFRWYKQNKKLVDRDLPLEEIDISDIDLDLLRRIQLSDFYRYLSWLASERSVGPAARARKVSALRAFFTYLSAKLHLLESNPAANLESPKKMKSLPRYLDMQESVALLASAASDDDANASRDYCILTLFLNCGMRLSELCGIDLADIREGQLRVLGKGNKERTIYLNKLCEEALADYLKVRHDGRHPDENALFISRNRRRISQRAVENVVKKYLLKAGLDPRRYSVHKLRHTAATLMYQYGEVDLRSLQQILGHESVATTEIYTHVTARMLEKAAEQHPLNQFSHALLAREAEDSDASPEPTSGLISSK